MKAIFTDCFGERVEVEVISYGERFASFYSKKEFGVRNKVAVRMTKSAIVPVGKLELVHDASVAQDGVVFSTGDRPDAGGLDGGVFRHDRDPSDRGGDGLGCPGGSQGAGGV